MIQFKLSQEQKLIQESTKEFAQQYISPGVIDRDQKSTFPKSQIRKLGELGYMGMMIPSKWEVLNWILFLMLLLLRR